ncbi:hypothetical protein EDB19DRAFT_1965798 [Suillus lakei]|nr:hypothetical protein EDB19DRAFT_1965798 [Suillus lakei]
MALMGPRVTFFTHRMDPITSGVTILQVVQTIAQASAFLYGYVVSVRNVPSSCQRLLDQCNSIRGVLATVMDIENDQSLPDNLRHTVSLLTAEDGPLAKLDAELNNLLPNNLARRKMSKKPRLTWPFKEKEAGMIADRLKQYYGDITTILAIDSWNTLKEVAQGVKEVSWTLQGIEEREKAEEYRKLLEWMNPVSCTDKHEASCRQRNPESGRWIFHNDQYVAWNKSDSAFLWLNGQPGHGKTILASSVIDEIQGSREAEPQTLAYFYCNFRDNRTTVAAAVLCSLVVQLLRESKDDWITKICESVPQEEGVLVSLRKLWKQKSNGEPCPTDLGFLRKLLVEASTLVHLPVLVIDALDECRDYPELVGHLINLPEDARLRLFVTSRSETEIKNAFHRLPTMTLKDSAEQMHADIHAHITEQLKTRKRFSRLPDTLKKRILEKLSTRAHGMFRWVQYQLDEIMVCKRHVDIEIALDNLPAGLHETYDRIIQAIQKRGQGDDQIVRSCLLWLAITFTPLTLDQLHEAMMIKVGQSSLNSDLGVISPMDIVVACGNLVTYDEKTGVVALSHYSVKEYLISLRPNSIMGSISYMHACICELLFTYVLCDSVYEAWAKGFTAGPAYAASGRDDYPLLSYAVKATLGHLRHVSDKDYCVITALKQLHFKFRDDTEKCSLLEHLFQPLMDDGQLSDKSHSRLFIPLQLGSPRMVETLVKVQPDLLNVDIAGGSGLPLVCAIASNPAFLSVLLKLGVDLNKPSFIKPCLYGQQDLPSGSYTPISWAVAIESEVAVEFLLSQTEVNLPDDILHTATQPYPSRDSYIAHRSKVKLGHNLYLEALSDAEQVIGLNPLSYLGYELNLFAELRQQYVTPSEVEDAIQQTVLIHLENAPLRLINTSTGRLCNRDAQINAFLESTECKELLSSSVMHGPLKMEAVKEAVAKHFGWAMLSHRWERREPLLHDIQHKDIYELDPVGTTVKLQKFCEVARNAGHRWAWSDTCCIDQNNNVELQQSVNSMFIWYHHSALTIVYLSDVPPSSQSGALANSVWNTRGWTVQEFLAPKIVLFYQADWTLYVDVRSRNHKESVSIMQELEGATGINAQALVEFHPGTRGSQEKLRWVSNRSTTREEDIAYSLFGIFDVNLPVIYGEKRQKALGRLLQEIIAHSGNIAALDWVGQSSNFNSCLPADISSYKAPSWPSLSKDEMQNAVSMLRNEAVESASKLYALLASLSVPRFANGRLQLPCVAFSVIEVRPRPCQDRAKCFAYNIKADGLQDLLITMEDRWIQFSSARPTRQTFLLIRPWNRHDLELPDFVDETQSADDWSKPGSPTDEAVGWSLGDNEPPDSQSDTRELRLLARLAQPFRALLLAQQRGGEYKRIASDQNIIASVDDITRMDARMLEIL